MLQNQCHHLVSDAFFATLKIKNNPNNSEWTLSCWHLSGRGWRGRRGERDRGWPGERRRRRRIRRQAKRQTGRGGMKININPHTRTWTFLEVEASGIYQVCLQLINIALNLSEHFHLVWMLLWHYSWPVQAWKCSHSSQAGWFCIHMRATTNAFRQL